MWVKAKMKAGGKDMKNEAKSMKSVTEGGLTRLFSKVRSAKKGECEKMKEKCYGGDRSSFGKAFLSKKRFEVR